MNVSDEAAAICCSVGRAYPSAARALIAERLRIVGMTKHQSALARTYCDGFPVWGKCLAHLGLSALVDQMGVGPIFHMSHDPAGSMLVLVEPDVESMVVTVFFRLKPGRLTIEAIAKGLDAAELVADWRAVSAAFVRFEVNLAEPHPLKCLDHNATEKAAHDLPSSDLLARHEKFFGDVMAELALLLERYRRDHGVEEVSERCQQLTQLNHYQPR